MSNEDQDQAPRNRKERRAAARSRGELLEKPPSAAEIPLRQPDRSGPKGKTLFELAEERQAELQAQADAENARRAAERGETLPADDPPIGPLGESIFLTSSLGMLHFTLDVLTFHQYRQEMEWGEIRQRSYVAVPVLFVLTYLLHGKAPKADSVLEIFRQALFFCIAVAAGCYMIYAGNTYDYYAVMQSAPPLGTLWIWSVIEMRLPWGLASVAIDTAFMKYYGYTVF